jgi:hypothetical protein
VSSPINKIKETTRKVEKAIVEASFESIWGLVVSKAPFFAWPIVKEISRFGLKHTLYFLTETGIIWFNTAWLYIHVGADFSNLENERQLAILAVEQGASDEELDDIDNALIEAFRKAHRVGRAPL